MKSYIRGIGAEVEFVGYPGALPKGLAFGSTRAAVEKALGKPADPDRWQFENKTRELRCLFDNKGRLVEIIWGVVGR